MQPEQPETRQSDPVRHNILAQFQNKCLTGEGEGEGEGEGYVRPGTGHAGRGVVVLFL
jgi:hypothetical protein